MPGGSALLVCPLCRESFPGSAAAHALAAHVGSFHDTWGCGEAACRFKSAELEDVCAHTLDLGHRAALVKKLECRASETLAVLVAMQERLFADTADFALRPPPLPQAAAGPVVDALELEPIESELEDIVNPAFDLGPMDGTVSPSVLSESESSQVMKEFANIGSSPPAEEFDQNEDISKPKRHRITPTLKHSSNSVHSLRNLPPKQGRKMRRSKSTLRQYPFSRVGNFTLKFILVRWNAGKGKLEKGREHFCLRLPTVEAAPDFDYAAAFHGFTDELATEGRAQSGRYVFVSLSKGGAWSQPKRKALSAATFNSHRHSGRPHTVATERDLEAAEAELKRKANPMKPMYKPRRGATREEEQNTGEHAEIPVDIGDVSTIEVTCAENRITKPTPPSESYDGEQIMALMDQSDDFSSADQLYKDSECRRKLQRRAVLTSQSKQDPSAKPLPNLAALIPKRSSLNYFTFKFGVVFWNADTKKLVDMEHTEFRLVMPNEDANFNYVGAFHNFLERLMAEGRLPTPASGRYVLVSRLPRGKHHGSEIQVALSPEYFQSGRRDSHNRSVCSELDVAAYYAECALQNRNNTSVL